jgi:hypothetical protein
VVSTEVLVGGPIRGLPLACRDLPSRQAESADRAACFVSRCWRVAFLRSPACRSWRDPRPDRPVSPLEAGASRGVRSRWRDSEEVCLGSVRRATSSDRTGRSFAVVVRRLALRCASTLGPGGLRGLCIGRFEPLASVRSPPERSAFVGDSASRRCRAEALRRGRGLLVAWCGLSKSAFCLPRLRVPEGAFRSGAWRSAPGGASCRVEPARRGQPVPAWGRLRRVRCTEVWRIRRPRALPCGCGVSPFVPCSRRRRVAAAFSGQDMAWFLPTRAAPRAVEAGKPASPVCCAVCVFRKIDVSLVAAALHPLAGRPRPVGGQVFGSATAVESSDPSSVRSPAAQVLRQRSPGAQSGAG